MGKSTKKPAELRGITDREAIQLYIDTMEELNARGQVNPATSAQLVCAAQWTEEANAAHAQIIRLRRTEDEDGKTAARIRVLMRNKAMAEGERRKIFDDLLLTPQRPRGRPPREEMPEEGEDDGGWGTFDDEAGDGAS